MSATPEFYTSVFDKLDASLASYISDTSSAVISSITPTATTLMTLYFVMYGIGMLRGVIDEPITDFLMRAVKIAFITGVALNVGTYNGEIASFLWNTPEALAQVVVDGNNSESNISFLDQLLYGMYDLGEAFWQYDSTGPSVDLGPKLIAVGVWVGGLILTAYAAFLMALAKMALTVLLAIGPIFIALSMFEGTKRFFESWMGQTLNFVFIVVLTAATVKLILVLLGNYLPAAISVATEDGTAINTALEALALTVIGCLVLMQLMPIASALAGGVALSTLGAGSAVWSKTKGAASGAKNVATGKTLSDMRGARRQKEVNRKWAENNPGMAARGAGMAMDQFRKVTQAPNRVKRA